MAGPPTSHFFCLWPAAPRDGQSFIPVNTLRGARVRLCTVRALAQKSALLSLRSRRPKSKKHPDNIFSSRFIVLALVGTAPGIAAKSALLSRRSRRPKISSQGRYSAAHRDSDIWSHSRESGNLLNVRAYKIPAFAGMTRLVFGRIKILSGTTPGTRTGLLFFFPVQQGAASILQALLPACLNGGTGQVTCPWLQGVSWFYPETAQVCPRPSSLHRSFL